MVVLQTLVIFGALVREGEIREASFTPQSWPITLSMFDCLPASKGRTSSEKGLASHLAL